MKIIKVQGGAGNQLFQASNVYSMLQDKGESVVLYTGALTRGGTKRDLFEPAWRTLNYRAENNLGIRLMVKLAVMYPLIDRILKYFGTDCVVGYFQEDFDVSYAAAAKKDIERDRQKEQNFQGVIHCRGGDYLEPPNDKIYWQLSVSDYEEAFEQMNISSDWAVLGNHVQLIPQIQAKGAENVQGSVVEDLALFGAAKTVVCSNSTFAFWGAVFCALSGGHVKVPAKYYCNDLLPNPFEALARKFPDQVKFFGTSNA